MENPKPSLFAVGTTLAGIALLTGLIFAVPALHDAVVAAFHGDSAEVRSQLDSLGAAGPLLILGLALIHAFVFYPAEIVDAAAGFVYGFFPALALMMGGRRRPRPNLALRLDNGAGLPADHRDLGLFRHQAGGAQPHRPARPRQRRCAAPAPFRRALDRPVRSCRNDALRLSRSA